jgi:hypothetical protein
MCRERDAILLGTLGFENCGIIVVWISHVIFDGFIESVIVNENGNRNDKTTASSAVIPNCPSKRAVPVPIITALMRGMVPKPLCHPWSPCSLALRVQEPFFRYRSGKIPGLLVRSWFHIQRNKFFLE